MNRDELIKTLKGRQQKVRDKAEQLTKAKEHHRAQYSDGCADGLGIAIQLLEAIP